MRITPKGDGSYHEFPSHSDLRGFDVNDHKFIAVAAAHPERPCVLQAFDSKWWGFRRAFQSCGITIEFLCVDEIQAKHKQKTGRRCS